MKTKRLPSGSFALLSGISLVIGLLVTSLLAVIVTSSKTYVDVKLQNLILCASLESQSVTRTEHGSPWPVMTTYQNDCADIPAVWHPLNIAGDVTFFSAMTSGIFYLRRKLA
jgi:hypothetical protein